MKTHKKLSKHTFLQHFDFFHYFPNLLASALGGTAATARSRSSTARSCSSAARSSSYVARSSSSVARRISSTARSSRSTAWSRMSIVSSYWETTSIVLICIMHYIWIIPIEIIFSLHYFIYFHCFFLCYSYFLSSFGGGWQYRF